MPLLDLSFTVFLLFKSVLVLAVVYKATMGIAFIAKATETTVLPKRGCWCSHESYCSYEFSHCLPGDQRSADMRGTCLPAELAFSPVIQIPTHAPVLFSMCTSLFIVSHHVYPKTSAWRTYEDVVTVNLIDA